MTDLTTPGEIGAAADNKSTSHAIKKAGGHNGYVVDGTDISEFYSELDTSNINAFTEVTRTGRDLTLSGGEAFVGGWLCRDRQTTITLPQSTTSTIYVGYNPDSVLSQGESPSENDNIILHTGDKFTADDPKLALYDVETGETSISSITDRRPMSRAEAVGPWRRVDDPIGTVPGPLDIQSSTFRNHLSIERGGIGKWSVSPTASYGDSLELRELNGSTNGTIHFTSDGHIHMDPSDKWAVEGTSAMTIYAQYGDPAQEDGTTVEEGDIWIRIN